MLSAGLMLCLVTMAAAQGREKLVVFEVTAGDDSTRKTAQLVEEQLLTELTQANRFEVLGQSEIVALLGMERQRQLLGCSEAQGSCIAEIGGALGARWLVMASLGRFGTRLRLDMKLIDTRAGKAAAREGRVLENDDDLFPTVTQLVAALLQSSGETDPSVRRPSPLPWLVAGGAVALLGAVSMGLGSMWGAQVNAEHAELTFQDAQSRMGLFQVMYWGGLVLAVGGAALVAVGAWVGLKPSEPAKSVSPVALQLTPSGLAVRW